MLIMLEERGGGERGGRGERGRGGREGRGREGEGMGREGRGERGEGGERKVIPLTGVCGLSFSFTNHIINRQLVIL